MKRTEIIKKLRDELADVQARKEKCNQKDKRKKFRLEAGREEGLMFALTLIEK